MTKQQEDTLCYYTGLLAQDVSSLGDTNILLREKEALRLIVTAIQISDRQLSGASAGITGGPNTTMEDLAQLTATLAAVLNTYTTEERDDLKISFIFLHADFTAISGAELAEHAKQIFAVAAANGKALLSYGVTANVLATLNTAINFFIRLSPAPGNSAKEKLMLDKRLTGLFNDAEKILPAYSCLKNRCGKQ